MSAERLFRTFLLYELFAEGGFFEMIHRIYGNEYLKNAFGAMMTSGRLPHGFIIHGEKGMGKKTAAHYMAKTLLCEKGGTAPCDGCRSCRNIDKGIHPDLIVPECSGKLMTYSVETIRNVCSDAIVAPNNGSRKVYFFPDADNILVPAQNALLKLIEEPPPFAYFIFTAKSKDTFLTTIISRVVSLGVSACSNDECLEALAERGVEPEKAQEAVKAFGGNIGMCINWLEDESLQKIVMLTKNAANSIINRDEYGLLVTLSSDIIRERNSAGVFFEMLGRVIRDAAVLQINPSAGCIGCCPDEAKKLSTRLRTSTADNMQKFIAKASGDIAANVNAQLVMTGLCGDIMSCKLR